MTLNNQHERWLSDVDLTFAGLADEETAARVTHHLQECAQCREEWERLEHFDGDRAWDFIEPDETAHASMRQAFQEKLAGDGGIQAPPADSPNPARSPGKSARKVRAMPWVMATAASVLVAAWGWQAYFHMAAQTRALTAMVNTVSESRQISLAAEPGAPTSRVDLYVRGTRAMVWVKALPALKPGETYEGWWIVNKTPLPAGTFATGPHFLPAMPKSAAAFAITIEPHGGTKAPTTPVLAAATLTVS